MNLLTRRSTYNSPMARSLRETEMDPENWTVR